MHRKFSCSTEARRQDCELLILRRVMLSVLDDGYVKGTDWPVWWPKVSQQIDG